MVKSAPTKAIKLWMESVNAAKTTLKKQPPVYGFTDKALLKKALQIYSAKMFYRPA